MRNRPTRPRARTAAAVATALSAAVLAIGPAAPGAQAAQASAVTVAGTKIVVGMRGNGHGHGMSQYGARGAAIAGRSYRQILAFYYPGTAVTTLPFTLIRVRLANAGTGLEVRVAPDLVVTGMSGVLASRGVARYRLVANAGTGVRLQALATGAGATWRTVRDNLANRATIHRAGWARMRVYSPDGSSTEYYGYLRAVRRSASGTAGGVLTVNVTRLENYVAGVVPREMPASWQAAAVDAQAVAARTYGEYAVEHQQSSDYDICDTTACQVYGGIAQYDRAGHLLTSSDPQAAGATANRVLTYKGSTIFAQYSASNGGWTVAGGQPYLLAKPDPYDNAASGDPYLYYTRYVAVTSAAGSYGLTKITKVEITARDGHGAAGGRVLSGYVTGIRSTGASVRLPTTGYQLSAALGAGTTWITVGNP